MNQQQVTLVYDGHCKLCSWGVAWALARIPRDKIRFIPAQNDEGVAILAKTGINALNPQTIVVQDGEDIMVKSSAVLYLLKMCGGFWAGLVNVLDILPAPFLDWIYSAIASRRYQLFGSLDTCYIPDTTAPDNNH